MQIGANLWICARPKVVNINNIILVKKCLELINVGGCIYCGYCVCVRSVYMVARCLSRGVKMKSNITFRNLTDKYGTCSEQDL